jgi:pterin-4a-carbinolamine dehydratase
MSKKSPKAPTTPTLPAAKPNPSQGLQKLKAERVELMLKSTPAWAATAKGHALRRRIHTATPADAIDFARRVTQLAARQRQFAEIVLRPGVATVRLTTPEVKGLTERDFALARAIDGERA